MKIIKEDSKTDDISLILLILFAGFFFVFLTFQYVGVGALENWFWVTKVGLVVFGCLFVVIRLSCYGNYKVKNKLQKWLNN